MTDQVTYRRLSPEAAEGIKLGIDRQVESLCKSFGINQAAKLWLAGMDVDEKGESKPNRPYAQVALVYTCVNKIISSILGMPLVLSNITEQVIESGPAYDLLFNSSLSWEKFVTETIGHYALSRDVFWVFTDLQAAIPKEILVVSGTQMYPITSDGTAGGVLLGWEFRGTGGRRVKFALDEVYQWKNFNPYDRFHGIGPVQASRLSIDYSFAADLYNSSALANGAEPGIILKSPGMPGEDQVDMLRSQFDHRHKGAGKTKRTAILTGGMDVTTVAMKMADMQVAEITQISDKKICSAFGVPPGVAGLVTEAQYSHSPAMQDFIFNTILPLASLFAGELTSGILSRFAGSKLLGNNFPPVSIKDSRFYGGVRSRGLSSNKFYREARYKAVSVQSKVFAWFDSNQHPTIAEVNREIADKVFKYKDAGIPVNNLIEVHDLPYEPVPWGNDWWLGMGQVPARFTLEAGLEGLTGPPYPGEQQENDESKSVSERRATSDERPACRDEPAARRATIDQKDERQRLRIWRNWVTSWLGIEREFSEAMRKFFLRQQRILIDKLKKAISDQRLATGDQRLTTGDQNKAAGDDIVLRVVFDLKMENEKIRVINRVFFEKASELGIRQSLAELLGLKGEKLDEAVEQAKRANIMRASFLRSSRNITHVVERTQKLISNQLTIGLQKGEGLTELAARIAGQLGGNLAKANTIARTQTGGAVGTGRHTGFKTAGLDLKGWLTARDENVRKAHSDAESDYAEGIDLDAPFIVDREPLMYPGDPAGSAGNIINCRCVEIAVKAAGKSFGMPFYSNVEFYSLLDMQKAHAEPEKRSKENGA